MNYDKMHDSITEHISYDAGFQRGEQAMLKRVCDKIDACRNDILNQSKMIQTQDCNDGRYKLLLIHNNVKLSLLMDIHDSISDV